MIHIVCLCISKCICEVGFIFGLVFTKMPRRRNLALSDKSTQASSYSSAVRPQRLFANSRESSESPSATRKFVKFAVKFLPFLRIVYDGFWRVASCVFNFLHTIFIMFAKHIYKLTCRVMLMDTWILRSTRPMALMTLLVMLCVVPLSLFAAFWISEVTSNTPIDCLQSICFDTPPSNFTVADLENDNISFGNQNETSVEYSDSKMKGSVTSDEVINELMKTGIIQNSIEEYANKVFENHDYFKLQHKLELKVQEQQQIINGLIDELYKIKSNLNSIQNIQTETMESGIESKLSTIFASFLNNPDSLNKQEAFKRWLHSLFITKSELETKLKIHDADKTGLVDYAMESMGGDIITSRCTKSLPCKALISFLGVPLIYTTKSPRVVINTNIFPGNCWPFENFPGILVIKLIRPIHIESFSVEHISKSLIPDGKIDSAPKNIQVYGLNDEQGNVVVQLAEFKYDYNAEPLQFFKAANSDLVFQYVEVVINSNHGNPNYTCLYRFRVHGKLPKM